MNQNMLTFIVFNFCKINIAIFFITYRGSWMKFEYRPSLVTCVCYLLLNEFLNILRSVLFCFGCCFIHLYSEKMTANRAERKTKLSKHLLQMKVVVQCYGWDQNFVTETGLTKTSRDDAGTLSLGPVSHQVDRRDGLGAITVSDAGTP